MLHQEGRCRTGQEKAKRLAACAASRSSSSVTIVSLPIVGPRLPMSTAVSAAGTTVEPTASVEPATTVEASTSAAMESAYWTAGKATSTDETTTADKSTSADKPTSTDEAATAPTTATPAPTRTPTATTPVSAIPRASADEHSTCEPARSVIAVRRARVRRVSVVAVLACRSSANVTRSNSHAHANPDLSL
jgi:hypothetical protein